MASRGFPRPPYGYRSPRHYRYHPHPSGGFIRLHKPRRFDRIYRAGADHYVVRLFGWRLILRLEPDREGVSDTAGGEGRRKRDPGIDSGSAP